MRVLAKVTGINNVISATEALKEGSKKLEPGEYIMVGVVNEEDVERLREGRKVLKAIHEAIDED